MDNLIILLSETRGGSIIEILFLLIVTVIIGYVTAWFYTRSIYNRRISSVIMERNKTDYDLISKTVTITGLHATLIQKDNEIDSLKKGLNTIKISHNIPARDAHDMNPENHVAEQFIQEKDLALLQIAKRKHLLNYLSFGTATEADKDDLKMISGIGFLIEERLNALDIYSFEQISKLNPIDEETISDIIEISPNSIERCRWVEQAQDLLKNNYSLKWFSALV